jgi:hypothetical protein
MKRILKSLRISDQMLKYLSINRVVVNLANRGDHGWHRYLELRLRQADMTGPV